MTKTQKQVDFPKKKSKIGKIIPRNNVTKITVKTKKLSIPVQTALTPRDALSYRELLDKLTKKLNHYNTSSKISALDECKSFLISCSNPDDHVALIVPTALEILNDDDRECRIALISFMSVAMKKCSQSSFMAIAPVIVNYICSGLTSINKGIRRDALLLAEAVVLVHPSLFTSSLPKILRYVLSLLSDSSSNTGPQSFLSLNVKSKEKTKQSTTLSVILRILNKLLYHNSVKNTTQASVPALSNEVVFDESRDSSYNAVIVLARFDVQRSSSDPDTTKTSSFPVSFTAEILSRISTIWRDLVSDMNALDGKAVLLLKDLLSIMRSIQYTVNTSSTTQVKQEYIITITQIMSHFPYQSQETLVAAHGSKESIAAEKLIIEFNVSICDLVLNSEGDMESEVNGESFSSLTSQYIMRSLASSMSIIKTRYERAQLIENDMVEEGSTNNNNSYVDDGLSSKLCRCIRVLIIKMFHTVFARSKASSQLLCSLDEMLSGLMIIALQNGDQIIGLAHDIGSLIGAICSALVSIDHISRCEGYSPVSDIIKLLQTISVLFTSTYHAIWQNSRKQAYEELFLKVVVHVFQRIEIDYISLQTSISIHDLILKIIDGYEDSSYSNNFLVVDVLFYAIEFVQDRDQVSQMLCRILRQIIKKQAHPLHEYLLVMLYSRLNQVQLLPLSEILFYDLEFIIENANDAVELSPILVPAYDTEKSKPLYYVVQDIDIVCKVMARYIDVDTFDQLVVMVLEFANDFLSSSKDARLDSSAASTRRLYIKCIAGMKLLCQLLHFDSNHETLSTAVCQFSAWLTIHLKTIALTIDQSNASTEGGSTIEGIVSRSIPAEDMVWERAVSMVQPMVDLLSIGLRKFPDDIDSACSLYLRFLSYLGEAVRTIEVEAVEDHRREGSVKDAVLWGMQRLQETELATMGRVHAVNQAIVAIISAAT